MCDHRKWAFLKSDIFEWCHTLAILSPTTSGRRSQSSIRRLVVPLQKKLWNSQGFCNFISVKNFLTTHLTCLLPDLADQTFANFQKEHVFKNKRFLKSAPKSLEFPRFPEQKKTGIPNRFWWFLKKALFWEVHFLEISCPLLRDANLIWVGKTFGCIYFGWDFDDLYEPKVI